MSRPRLFNDLRINGNQLWTSWGDTLDLQKSALRWDIKRTMKGLCSKLEEIGEECFVVTVNVNNGWVGHIGTVRGNEYINTKTHILYDFLNYCGESVVADSEADSVEDNESAEESDGEITHGYELRIGDGPNSKRGPDNILKTLANVSPDSEDEDNSVPMVEKLYLPYSSLLKDHPRKPVPETITKLNHPVAQGTGLNKSTETKSSSSDKATSCTHVSETSTASKILITDVRSQKQSDVSPADIHEDLESEKSIENSTGEKRGRGRKRKKEQTGPDPKLLPKTDELSTASSPLLSIPFSTSVANSSDKNKTEDAFNRVLRSSKRKRGRQPILAYLLNRGKRKDKKNDQDPSDEDDDEEEEELESMDEDIEEDDPKDEDWKLEKLSPRTSAKKK